MNLSNEIADLIMQMLEQSGSAELQRNELAQSIGCVPSQINYVISSRFTPEQGYIVESRRGGGGFIKITRVNFTPEMMLMHVINTIGNEIDERTCRAHIINLTHGNFFDEKTAGLISAACLGNALREVESEKRGRLRAAIFKQMLLTL